MLLALPTLHAQQDPSISVRAANSKIVSACADKLEAGTPQATKRIDYAWSALCRSPDAQNPNPVSQGEQAHYTIKKKADGIHLAAKIRMNIEPKSTSTKRAAFMLDKSRECMRDLNHYWKRYGIELDFDVDSNRTKTPQKPDYELVLSDKTGRSHSRLHYFNGLDTKQPIVGGLIVNTGPYQACLASCRFSGQFFGGAQACPDLCEPIRQQEFCLMVLHEVGHLVGLKDEYADPMCPNREFVSTESNPWSVMAAPSFGFLDNIAMLNDQNVLNLNGVEFFPRHIHTIIDQLCPPDATTAACGQQNSPAPASGIAACPATVREPASQLVDPELVKTILNH